MNYDEENKNSGQTESTENDAQHDTEDEMSVMEFAQEAFASAKKAATNAAGKAKDFIQTKADETDLDEKAIEFAKKASTTAKSALNTAAEKTKAFIDKNDLDEKADAFVQDAAVKAKQFGNTVAEKAKALAQNLFGSPDDNDDE